VPIESPNTSNKNSLVSVHRMRVDSLAESRERMFPFPYSVFASHRVSWPLLPNARL
jgi:hypothetical protein